ncbi:amino acid racemase [Brenneria goodwinii]|uniref:aspartate/glutamate racemase family protein n=1 Tax=Brenneria goodwinii TaxID=1109412 RepID=UPI000EF18308|nr:amino acid racemase [Brenneria goodwinii]MCG8157187.1 amino acid racemase [Brenneria goodwinii]MCG8160073.1 amino acid racemase [Brenneria goodwinii]MCG8164596.1 amino acid racemase [Brenneria goodwinii]MCG8170698.1 amino acid racemase [Brenneria goodwinii]MCG8174226.1 amino acid racemase [Brenneria goodwinii]
MDRIGLIGGVSWVSTMEYYKRVNTFVQEHGKDLESADLVLISLNFSEILKAQKDGDSETELKILTRAAIQLEEIGVKKILICSNTTSNMCDRLAEKLGVPVINIIDATTNKILSKGITRVGLIGTKYVMEKEFYRNRLEEKGITVIVPKQRTRDAIHNCIYKDLCHNVISNLSRGIMYRGIDELAEAGVNAVILGCTEIPLVVNELIYQGGVYIVDSIDAHLEAVFPTYTRDAIVNINKEKMN